MKVRFPKMPLSLHKKTDVSPEMNGLLRASNSVEARALALDAGRRMADPNVQIKSDKSADEILKLTFGNKDIRDDAKALAQKVTEEAFQTFGHLQDGFGSKGERIADEKPNGIAVRPLQMRADVESILMNYAGGVALGITNHATYGMGKQFVDSVGQRIERESRAYGQYGVDKAQGGIVSMFNKALTAMNSQIERKLPKAIINA